MNERLYLHRTHLGVWFLSDLPDPRDYVGAGNVLVRHGFLVSDPTAPFSRDITEVLAWAEVRGIQVEQVAA